MCSLCLSVSASRCADALGVKDGEGTHASQNDEEVESVAGPDHGDDDTWVVSQEAVLVDALSFTEPGMLQRLSILLFVLNVVPIAPLLTQSASLNLAHNGKTTYGSTMQAGFQMLVLHISF
jgi:hypothetical protein